MAGISRIETSILSNGSIEIKKIKKYRLGTNIDVILLCRWCGSPLHGNLSRNEGICSVCRLLESDSKATREVAEGIYVSDSHGLGRLHGKRFRDAFDKEFGLKPL